MAIARSLVLALVLSVAARVCYSEESKESEDDNKSFGDPFGDSMQGMNKWFRGMSDNAKERTEDGLESMKGMSADAKKSADDGVDVAKNWAGGMGDSFSKARDSMMENGEKTREAFGEAALNTKGEIETAFSKFAKHAKDSSDAMFKMFG